jgi:hypothetical protein
MPRIFPIAVISLTDSHVGLADLLDADLER